MSPRRPLRQKSHARVEFTNFSSVLSMNFVTAQPKAEGAPSAMTTSIRDNSRAAAHHQAHRYVSGLNQYQI